MIYWKNIPQDRRYHSRYRSTLGKKQKRKFLSVEVDEGGWNNIRMTVEIAMALAHATGRTFILPPRQGAYLLEKPYSLHDFYNLDGLDVIEMHDFLEQQVMTGNIRNRKGRRVFPPRNRTNWAVRRKNGARRLDYFMRTISISPKFLPLDRLMFVPKKPTRRTELMKWNEFRLDLMDENDSMRQTGVKYFNNPTPVNASAKDRFEEVIQERDLWLYDEKLHREPLIHFMAEDALGIRIHDNFYHALFFQDWKMDLVVKRYMRDRLRYKDEIFCAAGRVVEVLRQKSLKDGNGGKFYTYHVRRNDFAWIHLVNNAHDIYWNSYDLVPENATVYVATDEKDKGWFLPFLEKFKSVYFLEDFIHLLGGMSSNYYGILDQIIAARGEIFVGAYYSTVTMHTMHLRGHYSQAEKRPGWELGIMDSYYYAPKEHKDFFRIYRPFGDVSSFDTAFPIAWRDIDKGI